MSKDKGPIWLRHFSMEVTYNRKDQGRTELDVQIGPSTELTEDRTDQGPKWTYTT